MAESAPASPTRAALVPRVDFAFGAADKWRAACTTVARHVEAGHLVIVYCSQTERLKHFDLLLWGFEPAAFIPHVMVDGADGADGADDALAARTPVVLTPAPLTPEQAHKPQAWLLNLDTDCPPMSQHYARILEVVCRDEADTSAARQRWRHYQQQGYSLRSHDLRAQFQAQSS